MAEDGAQGTVDCVVPAAGRSERMGQWKPILAFGGATILQTVVWNALAACGRVILVVGYRGQELAALFQRVARVRVVQNPQWELGMFSSIRRGAAEVTSSRFFITPGDMPWIGPGVYSALEAAKPDPAARPQEAVFPVFHGRRGHPVLMSERIRQAVLEADPGGPPMRQIVARFAVRELEWGDDSILRDIDTPEDYP